MLKGRDPAGVPSANGRSMHGTWAATFARAAFLHDHRRIVTEGQQRVFDLQAQGDVLDENLYTTPGKFGAGGAATTRLVGEAEDVASSGSCCPIRPFYRNPKADRTLLPLLQEEAIPA